MDGRHTDFSRRVSPALHSQIHLDQQFTQPELISVFEGNWKIGRQPFPVEHSPVRAGQIFHFHSVSPPEDAGVLA